MMRMRYSAAATSALMLFSATAAIAQGHAVGREALRQAIHARAKQPALERAMSYTPLIQPNTWLTDQIGAGDATLDNGMMFDHYLYQGQRNELAKFVVASDFEAVVVVLREVSGQVDEIAESRAATGTSTLELKLPANETYHLLVVSSKPGTGGPYKLTATSQGSVTNVDWGQVFPGGGDPNGKYALLVGVSDYPGEDLDLDGGPLLDVQLVADLLINKWGFKPENVRIIRDAEGNRDEIIEGFRRHLAQAGPNGVAVFFYSGHGMQMNDNRYLTGNDDPEPDNKDEALAVWGTTGDKYGYLLDDEMNILVSELKAGRVLVMLDDCFAGTATREGFTLSSWQNLMGVPQPKIRQVRNEPTSQLRPQVRYVKERDLGGSVENPAHFVTPLSPVAKSKGVSLSEYANPANHILLAASADSETSMNFPFKTDDGKEATVGLFTAVFYSMASQAPADITFADLMARVSAKVNEIAMATRKKSQTPQIEGQRRGEVVAAYLK